MMTEPVEYTRGNTRENSSHTVSTFEMDSSHTVSTCLKAGSDQLNDQSRDDHSASWNQKNRHQKNGQNPCPWARPVDFA